eukprot:6725048-Pyramimonas_sp.AAC.1
MDVERLAKPRRFAPNGRMHDMALVFRAAREAESQRNVLGKGLSGNNQPTPPSQYTAPSTMTTRCVSLSLFPLQMRRNGGRGTLHALQHAHNVKTGHGPWGEVGPECEALR